ncbi:MAG: methyltransferase domain-containing protein [Candidatus Lokiarchaeota archaeon]|nr:methyltransferase domain-containing protein [Candidatus Lokiarchaeota archaeon]
MGPQYDKHRNKHKIDKELQMFVELLPKGGKILDAGSGSGEPASKFLADAGFDVIGIDLSETMLKMAQKNVSNAKFLKMDIASPDFEEESFDGILSLFALFHIPRKEHKSVFDNFYRLLKSGGTLMINTGVSGHEGFSNFFGSRMFWSNWAPEKTLSLVKEVGFSIIFEGVLSRGGEIQYWIFARK